MKHRNPIVVILLTFITLGIYGLVWSVKTKLEMNRLGAKIPTAWLIIIPFVNIWWMWKYSQGVEQVTGGKISTILSFVLLFLLGVFGYAILQFEFNKVGDTAVAAQPEVLDTPAPGFGAPIATPSPDSTAAPVTETAQTAPEVTTVAEAAPVQPESTPVFPSTPEQQPPTEDTQASSDPQQPPTQQV